MSYYEYQYVEGCFPCSFVCYCCDIRYWRCMNGDAMYERKHDDSVICENCHRGTNGDGLGHFCQWCYDNNHFICDCCKEGFSIKGGPNRKRYLFHFREMKESEKCCILRPLHLEMMASEDGRAKRGEGNYNFEHDHMCENCAIATYEGTGSCGYCHSFSYFVCSCCDREFSAENLRNKYRESGGGAEAGTGVEKGKKDKNNTREVTYLYVCEIENEGDNEEVNEEQKLCNDCAHGSEGGTRVCLYCLK